MFDEHVDDNRMQRFDQSSKIHLSHVLETNDGIAVRMQFSVVSKFPFPNGQVFHKYDAPSMLGVAFK
jgi:hypothetical protein